MGSIPSGVDNILSWDHSIPSADPRWTVSGERMCIVLVNYL